MFKFNHMSLVAALSVLGACAAQGPFPSLAPRAIERLDSTAPAPPCLAAVQAPAQPQLPEPALVADDPQIAARVSELLGEARRGQSDFAAALTRANSSVARAGSQGSDTWLAAQSSISAVEAARARSSDAAAELDRLLLTRSEQPTSEADLQALRAAAEEMSQLQQRQQAELDRLRAGISEPQALRHVPSPAQHSARFPGDARLTLARSGRADTSPGAQPKAGRPGSCARG